MAKTDKDTETSEKRAQASAQPAEGTYAALLAKAKLSGDVKVLTPKFLEFKASGQCVLGAYKGRIPVGGGENKKAYYQYIFETDDGPVKFHLGNVTDGEAGALMTEGEVYMIEYLGQDNIAGGKRVNKFNIIAIGCGSDAPVGGSDDLPI